MGGNKTNVFPGPDMLEMQQKFLEACRIFSLFMPETIGEKSQTKNPVTEALEYWLKSTSPFLPEGNTAFVKKILEQSRIYYAMGEQFIRLFNEMKKLDKNQHGWESLLNQQFDELKTVFSKSDKDANETVHKMLGAWQLMPMDTLQRTFSLSSVMPGDFLGELKRDSLQEVTDKFLSIPGVGYSRESQEKIQEGMRLWNEYQKICQEYNQAMCQTSVKAIDSMYQKILTMSKEGKEFKSLREIYDLWIDCNEESYASYVYTSEYSELYGRLTNALLAVKQHGRNVVDETLNALNVPTYKGINTLQKRQHDMRREQKAALKKLHELQKEISTLQGQVKQSRLTDTQILPLSFKKIGRKKKKINVNGSTKSRTRIKISTSRKKTVKHAKKDNMIVIKI